MKRIIFAGLMGLLLSLGDVQAVIIAGSDGTGNTDGTDVVGWSYVGKISHASATSSVTYVGDNWFITAYHIKVLDNPTGVVFNASAYNIDASSWTRITNSTSNADLVLFKVNESVTGVSKPTIASSTPSNGTAVTMIGNGRNRATGKTYWVVDTSKTPWIWTETSQIFSNAYGYKWVSGSAKRWGTNAVSGTQSAVDTEYGKTETIYTVFDDNAGEAQGATYDSGGGVFTGTTDNWELAGIMITMGTYSGQPGSTAVFGNLTYIADLSEYRDQIVQTIPEPISMVLLGPGLLMVFGYRGVRRGRFIPLSGSDRVLEREVSRRMRQQAVGWTDGLLRLQASVARADRVLEGVQRKSEARMDRFWARIARADQRFQVWRSRHRTG